MVRKTWPKTNLTSMFKAGIEARQHNTEVVGNSGVNLNHRKLWVVDGQTAITGGMNIGDNYAKTWQDLLATIKGPAVSALDKEFSHDWQVVSDAPADIAAPPAAAGAMPVQVLVTSPKEAGRERQIHAATLAVIDHAKDSLWIENPYFSDSEMIDHLDAALARNVKVNIILPKGNDEPIFTDINSLDVGPLSEHGAKIWLVDSGENCEKFNHTKLLVADEEFVIMGSCNADPRAFNDNQEMSIGVADRSLAKDAMERIFKPHLAESVPFTMGERPANAELIRYMGSIL